MEKDKFCDPLQIELDNGSIIFLERLACDELWDDENEVFFFGRIIDSDSWITAFPENQRIDENQTYVRCPECGNLFVEDQEPETGALTQCPKCSQAGTLYDFRDKDLPLESLFTRHMAVLENLEKGYVLRLFDAGLYYADRDYDDFETLSCAPQLSMIEVAREYWCEGKVSFYKNLYAGDVWAEPKFMQVETLDDREYYIYNYDNDFATMGSGLIDDILAEDPYKSKIFMESVAKKIPYRTFLTLQKYDFETLIEQAIYVPNVFSDSTKISEVLAVDYNRIKASFEVGSFSVIELLAARELTQYGLEVSVPNVNIICALDHNSELVLQAGNARKTMKYLRNQVSRSKNGNTAMDYGDYIQDCVKLGYDLADLEIMYPSNLKAAHAKTTKLVEIENSRATEEGVRRAYERFHSLCEWSDGIFAVIMPQSCEAIIQEGIDQHHCIGKYCERVASGEDLILFVRRAENLKKAFYTMEIRLNLKKLDVVQCRGYDNEDESPEAAEAVKAFLDRYANWFGKRPVVEAPEMMKRRYYKAVKKTADGRYISAWDNKTEYIVGQEITAKMCEDPDRTAVPGIHIASLPFAQKYGDCWPDVAILEIEVNMADVVIPDAKDQIRTKRGLVLREVPMEEMGEWGKRHQGSAQQVA